MLLAAKLLLTLLALGFSVAPSLADFNKTHATNPLWTGHARFHVVWQVMSYNLIALVVLALLWLPGAPDNARFYFAWCIAACVYTSFFIALGSMSKYGGANYDDNAYPPFKVKLLNSNRLLDLNTSVFTVQATLLALSLGLALAS